MVKFFVKWRLLIAFAMMFAVGSFMVMTNPTQVFAGSASCQHVGMGGGPGTLQYTCSSTYSGSHRWIWISPQGDAGLVFGNPANISCQIGTTIELYVNGVEKPIYSYGYPEFICGLE